MVLAGITLLNKYYKSNSDVTLSPLNVQHGISEFSKEKYNNYHRQYNSKVNAAIMLSFAVLVIEVFISFYLITTVWKSHQGAARLFHILLLISFPIPYLFFMLFFGNEKSQSILNEGFFRKNSQSQELGFGFY